MMKERMKGERGQSNTATTTPETLPTAVAKVPKFMLIMKEEPQKESNAKVDFNPTGDVDIEDDEEGLGNSFKVKKKEKKGEDFDFEDEFDDDNKEDRFKKNTEFNDDKKNLSAESKDLKKLMREKNQEAEDFSDDDEKEFAGVEELLEKKGKETKPGEKRPADSTQTPTNAKKPRTEATPNGKNPVSEKEIEKQIREYLSVHGKVPLNKVITKFRDVATISKQSFRDVLKRLVEAKQENKVTYLYLKDDQYREFR